MGEETLSFPLLKSGKRQKVHLGRSVSTHFVADCSLQIKLLGNFLFKLCPHLLLDVGHVANTCIIAYNFLICRATPSPANTTWPCLS